MKKKDDPYFFFFSELCPHSELSPFEKNLDNLVCKISQKVFLLVPSCWYADWGQGVDHLINF